ncbi:MAG: M23 family metallopeptidase [Cyclobacteriaceae bacterium]|nr:M23 family metallopeptidase [Cyclobacteriaceae bacterium]
MNERILKSVNNEGSKEKVVCKVKIGNGNYDFEKIKLEKQYPQPKEDIHFPVLEGIIKEYNSHVIVRTKYLLSNAQYNFRRNPNKNHTVRVSWEEADKQLFRSWLKRNLPKAKDSDWVKDADMGKKLEETRSPLITNKLGMLFIPVDVGKTLKGCRLRISLFEYPLAMEATANKEQGISRETDFDFSKLFNIDSKKYKKIINKIKPTGFDIVWNQDRYVRNNKKQTTEDYFWDIKQSGTKVRDGKTYDIIKDTAFKGAEIIDVPPRTGYTDYESLHKKSKCFSKFYRNGKPEYVLFALRWCQPVWSSYEEVKKDKDGKIKNGDLSQDLMVQNNKYKHMYLSTYYNTKDYGQFYASRSKRIAPSGYHLGCDIAVKNEEPIFTIKGGKIQSKLEDNINHGAGNKLIIHSIIEENDSSCAWEYLHLHDFAKEEISDGNFKEITTQTILKSGQILGTGGRTGFDATKYPSHLHLYLNIPTFYWDSNDKKNNRRPNIKRFEYLVNWKNEQNENIIDKINSHVIPGDNLPFLFPCRAHYNSSYNGVNNCKFLNNTYVSSCWVVKDYLACPYMSISSDEVRNRRIQSQLRKLSIYTGTIDGQIGSRSSLVAIKNFRNRYPITGPLNNKGTPDNKKAEISDSFITELNKQSPVKKPNQ